ncbi:FAD binding domain-containing protein [Oceanobacillus massiliensis]|uniref:FAD binding domain-containing protein n=1 Tax=Oceanobacillus massiliensis TaxID=1465765 RepID=UPI000289DDE4|nr:FAD binding domain-containing protein [Oceanobacillus massiliensis]
MPKSESLTKLWRPNGIDRAWELKQQLGADTMFIAGGTLIQLQREQGTAMPAHLISLEWIDSMNGINEIKVNSKEYLRIGSLAALSAIQLHPIVNESYLLLADAAGQVASPAVRNRATIGGNICYAVGDTLPALIAMDAEATWYDGEKTQTDKLENYLNRRGPQKDAIFTSILIPKRTTPENSNSIRYYRKVGRREEFIPSLVTVAVSVDLNRVNRIEEIRLAAGGGTYRPHRLMASEQLLAGTILSKHALKNLHEKIIEEYQPDDDFFATAHYRKMMAANLIIAELASYLDS